MVELIKIPYPGSAATPAEILRLADEYRSAARDLLPPSRRGGRLSRAPGHLCAIHAIELYLNAFLLQHGDSPERVRSRWHDLAARAALAGEQGLRLQPKTALHLTRMINSREYLVMRYGPDAVASCSETTWLTATLKEVAQQARQAILGKSAGPGAGLHPA